MNFVDFELMYADTMLNYQRIENDIKLIYSFMSEGNVDDNYEQIENKTLGQMIRLLQDLDNRNETPIISASDYNFLKQICDNRNHWAHQVFLEFIYEDCEDFTQTKEYNKQCRKLIKDNARVERASDILEKIRIEYCTKK